MTRAPTIQHTESEHREVTTATRHRYGKMRIRKGEKSLSIYFLALFEPNEQLGPIRDKISTREVSIPPVPSLLKFVRLGKVRSS